MIGHVPDYLITYSEVGTYRPAVMYVLTEKAKPLASVIGVTQLLTVSRVVLVR